MSTTTNGRERAKAFGTELRVARARTSFTQEGLAQHVDVHATAVSQWERGDRADVPNLDKVQALDDALNAGGKLIEAAEYASAKPDTTGGMLPLPEGLDSADIRLLLELAERLAR